MRLIAVIASVRISRHCRAHVVTCLLLLGSCCAHVVTCLLLLPSLYAEILCLLGPGIYSSIDRCALTKRLS